MSDRPAMNTGAGGGGVGRAALLLTSLVAGALVIQGAVLAWMGQPATCACGVVRLWSGVVLGPENSQQVADWYTPSHVIHGILFLLGLRLLLPRAGVATLLGLALILESGWEIAENSPTVIEHYRRQALAQGYSGDSILNSLSDTLAMVAGFALARTLPAWASLALALALEVFTGVMIRDGLILNVIQFVWPVEAIQRWQMGYS